MRVLFVHYGEDWVAGSETALLEMLRGFPRSEVEPFLWCNAPAMLAAGKAAGVPTEQDELQYYFNYNSPRFSPRAYSRMVDRGVELIRKTGAEVVHCNSGAPAQWMRLACWRTHTPMVANIHARYFKRSRYVLGLHLADHVVGVTHAVTDPFLADGMEPERVSVVHNGFDPAALARGDATRLRSELGIDQQAVVGIIAGGLIHLKGHDILFDAMRILRADRPFVLLVAGGGPREAELRALSADLPVHFIGHRSDLGAVLRDAADFLIAPSRQESFGRVIIEAAFAGKPAIGARIEGIPEAIAEGETGLLAQPENPASLADSMALMIGDGALRRRLGEAARERAFARFLTANCTAAMADVYRQAIADVRRPKSAQSRMRRLRPYFNLLTRPSHRAVARAPTT